MAESKWKNFVRSKKGALLLGLLTILDFAGFLADGFMDFMLLIVRNSRIAVFHDRLYGAFGSFFGLGSLNSPFT